MTTEEREWLQKAIDGNAAINAAFTKHVDKVYWDAVLKLRMLGVGMVEAHQTVVDALNSPSNPGGKP